MEFPFHRTKLPTYQTIRKRTRRMPAKFLMGYFQRIGKKQRLKQLMDKLKYDYTEFNNSESEHNQV